MEKIPDTPVQSSREGEKEERSMSRDVKIFEGIPLLLSQGAAAPSVDEGLENEISLLLSQGVAAPSVDEGFGVEFLLLTQGVAAMSLADLLMQMRSKEAEMEVFSSRRWRSLLLFQVRLVDERVHRRRRWPYLRCTEYQ